MIKPASLLRDAVAGTIVSLVAVSFYVSSAALLFQGALATYLPIGIGMALAGGALMSVISAARGSVPLASTGPEPATVPVLAAMTGAVAAQCAPQALLPTAVVGLALAAACIGLAWFLLGFYKVGGLVRYIPYPVVGGFLAAVGWLLFSGGLGVVQGEAFSLRMLLDRGVSAPLVAGVLVAGGLLWGTLRVKHVLLLPGLIVTFSLLIYGWFAFAGLDVAAAREAGWLTQPFERSLPVSLIESSLWSAVDWGVLRAQWGVIASAVVVGTIGLLLSEGSLEVAWDTRADANHDLRVLGAGNLLVAGIGGLVGGISISRSLLNREAGAVSSASGLFTAAICVAMMFVGGPLVALIPKAVLGGILMYLGAAMLKTWLVDGRRRLAPTDYAVVGFMVALTMAFGYLPAVVAGVVVCCFDFAVSSASLGAVRRILSRNDWPGHVERGGREVTLLHDGGQRLRIVELQGTLFFGSVQTLVQDLEALLERERGRLDELVLDFRRVAVLDSSAAQALTRLLKTASKHRVRLAFSAVPEGVRTTLQANGCMPAANLALLPSIDAAVAGWEDRYLLEHTVDRSPPLTAWLEREMGSAAQARALVARLERVELGAGEPLFLQDEAADALYLVEAGRLSVTLHRQGKDFPVRTIQAGATVGEMGLYRARPRSATVRAEVPTRVLKISQQLMAEIEREAPELAFSLHRLFVRVLAGRLEQANANASALAA